MEGKILDYNSETKQGLIKSTDGNRYEFVAEEYRSQAEIKIGQNVDFQAEADNRATAIYLIKNELVGKAASAASAAAESFGKFINKENVDKLAQSAKSLADSEGVSKSAQSVKQLLFKPFVLPIVGIALLVILFLAFFRGGTERKKEELVKCQGFSVGLAPLLFSGSPILSSVDAELSQNGITSQDTFSSGAAAQIYAKDLDPAKVGRLQTDGASIAKDYIDKQDAKGIATFLKNCVSTYKDLGK